MWALLSALLLMNPPDTQRYLFYLHGAIVEGKASGVESPVWGRYEVDQIVNRFKSEGFTVISEIRPANTDVVAYAEKIAAQVRALLNQGIPAGNITLVGGSKGAVIAMHAAALLQVADLNVVLLGGCNTATFSAYPELRLYGNVLSVYEATDPIGHSCEELRRRSAQSLRRYRELEIHTGQEHGFQFRPYAQWMQPAIRWAQGHYD